VFVATVFVATAGCTSRIQGVPVGSRPLDTHRELVTRYFDAVNAAADQGSATQERLFVSTQHPDFRDIQCSLQGLTVTTKPAYTTLHTDPAWHPPLAEDPPRGTVYVIAATVTVHSDTAVLGSQVGTLHVVVLDGIAYGFTPCPA
ncbi:MAG: hypothetical protein ACRDSL_11390, partial [Pseudonocardiaceae bacterium]